MATAINERVSVLALCKTTGVTEPVKVSWRGRVYPVTAFGHHHTIREGRTLIHIFSVVSAGSAMRLRLDSETLLWELEEMEESSL